MAFMRRRFGCLGCLGKSAVALFLGLVVLIAIDVVFTPWAFYLGGSRHLFPVWQGMARIHAASGDSTLYFWISPSKSTPRYNLPLFKGWGYLCTARGERFPLRVQAALRERPGSDTNGQEMSLTFARRPWYYTFYWPEHRPEFHFRGRWQNPDFVASDEGSFSRVFLPDGSVYLGSARTQPKGGDPITVAFHEVPWSGWFADCRAGR